MKTKNKMLRLGALLMTALLFLASPVSAYATNNRGASGGENTAGVKSPVIDGDRTGSLTIYKYDKTIRDEMNEADIKNAAGTETMGKYGVSGVEFTYVKISDLSEHQTRTVKTVSGNEIVTGMTTVFELDPTLKGILWPPEAEQPEGVSLGDGRTGHTTTQLNAALARLYGGGGDGMTGAPIAVKDKLESYVKTKEGRGAFAPTDANGMTKAEDLPLGLYLVVETGVPKSVTSTVNPFFVSIPMTNAAGDGWDYDITVYPKDQLESEEDKPTLDKYVRKVEGSTGNAGSGEVAGNAGGGETAGNTGAGNAGGTDKKEGYQDVLSASFGDELEYRVVCRLPVITSEATFLTELAIKDEVTGGLKYVDDSFRIDFYENEADAKAGTGTRLMAWDQQGSTFFTVTDTDKEELTDGYSHGKTIIVTGAGLKVINEGGNGGANYSGKYMAVTYRAELVPDGASLGETPNRNHARLHWKRTGGGILDPDPGPEDETPVFTYGIRIDKVFQRGEKELEIKDGAIKDGLEKDGVKFRLRKEGSGYVTAKETAGDTSTDTPGTDPGDAPEKAYDVTGFAGTEAQATPLSPGSDGKLLLRGLSAGTYILEETETLSDFALLVNDVTITITETEAELLEVPPETGTGPTAGTGLGTDAGSIVDTEPGTDAGPTADTAPGNDTAPGTGRKTWVVKTPATATVTGLGDAGAEVKMESYMTEDGKTWMNALVRLEVINKALPFLADTGGMGIWPFILGGGALILLSLLLLWRRKKKSVTAGMLAFVVLAGTMGAAASFEAEAVDLTEKCSLTVETAKDSGIPEVERPDLVVDLYKIADAVPEGSDVTGNEGPRYDMYTLELTDEFIKAQGSGTDAVTQKDLDAILYADDGAGTHDSYLALAGRATKTVLGIQVDQEEGREVVSAIPGKTTLQKAGNVTLSGGSTSVRMDGLEAGLYLMIPHGAALTAPEDYTVTLEGGGLATVAYGRQYSYRYVPELVALPQRDPTKTDSAAGSSDAWIHDVTATLKAEVGSQYASLKIVKKTAPEPEAGKARPTGEDHFVYQVEATFGGKSVYSNVVMLTMPGDKTQAERTLELIVPVGAEIRVTEVYTGASHELAEGAGAIQVVTSAAKDTAAGPGNIVEFTNKYNGTGTGGGAVENQFTYGGKDDGDKGWNWSPDPETVEKTGTQTP